MITIEIVCKVCQRRLLSEGTSEQVFADVERFRREHPHPWGWST